MEMKYFSDLRRVKDQNYEQMRGFMLGLIKNSVPNSEFAIKTRGLWNLEEEVLISSLLQRGYDAAIFSQDNNFLGHIAYQEDASDKSRVNVFSVYIAPSERKKGLAYKFAEELIQNLRKKGYQKINIGKEENIFTAKIAKILGRKQSGLKILLEKQLACLL